MKTSLLLGALLVFGAPLTAQQSEADSVKLHEQAKELQIKFEAYREQRMIPELPELGGGGGCDDIVGRMCLRYGRNEDSEDRERIPEPVELGMARVRLIREFSDIADDIPGDRWLLGQRVLYLGEAGRWSNAESLARRCGGGSNWWCTALVGYTLQAQGDVIQAEEVFERALREMPEDEAKEWKKGKLLLRPSTYKVYKKAEDKDAMWDRLWLLADPLYLVDGNDRKTENYAREVYVRLKRDALNAFGMEWGDDLEEIRIRWGMPWMWTRTKMPRTQMSLADNRQMGNSFSSKNRFYLPSGDALESPSEVTPDSWRIDSDRPWALHTARYAQDMRQLESQVARFRRGDSLLVVGAFTEEDTSRRSQTQGDQRIVSRPRIINMRRPQTEERSDRQQRSSNPFMRQVEEPEPFYQQEPEPDIDKPILSGLILIDEATEERYEIRGEGPDAAYMLQVPNGRYIMSLEALDEETSRGWRDRYGVWQDDLVFGLAGLSDILVLRDEPELPDALVDALPQAMPVVRISSGEAFQIAWEMYGMTVGETAQIRIGVDKPQEGALRRLGQFLRVLEPTDPIDLTFQDQGPDVLGTVFRSVRLNLPDLEPGNYTITVEVTLSGREPMATTRVLEVVE
jgi:tetratricopeptide (TPR) repeat protein